MVLLMTVMLSLAFVYPNGRKLTEATDKKTKATEIAKSIMEEIQAVPLFPNGNVAGNNIGSYSLVVSNVGGGNRLNNLNRARMHQLQWPYHQLAGTWDATSEVVGDTVVCPFFICDAANLVDSVRLNYRVRPFFILADSGTVLGGIHLPRGIEVSPDVPVYNSNNARIGNGDKIPIIARITVSVCWANKSPLGHTEDYNYSFVQLVNTRTENIY
jgi:hypothetical protein